MLVALEKKKKIGDENVPVSDGAAPRVYGKCAEVCLLAWEQTESGMLPWVPRR